MPDPHLIADVIADELARERGSVTGTEREAARRGAVLALELAAEPPGRPSIPSWYCPDPAALADARRSAWLVADQTCRAQVVHHHPEGEACRGDCELLAMDGAAVPYPEKP